MVRWVLGGSRTSSVLVMALLGNSFSGRFVFCGTSSIFRSVSVRNLLIALSDSELVET